MYKQNRFFVDVQNTVAERFRKTHLIYEEFGLNLKTDFNPHIRFDPQRISNLSEHTFIREMRDCVVRFRVHKIKLRI